MEILNPSKATGARKRGAPQQAQQPSSHHSFEPLKLERVYGSGSCAAAAIACPHPAIPGLLAYSCGAVVVLYDSQHKQQTAFFSPKPRRSLVTGKPYACLAFSRDGAYLAAGERSPQSPEILVWEVSSSRCLQTLKGHKHGIGSIAFSQDGRLLVSTGESYDGQLCVWDWQAGVLLARQHTQAEVQRACFAEELGAGASGLSITTVGKAGHFKVWSLTLPSGRGRDGPLTAGQASLTPRPASLKEYRTSNFVSVAAAPADGSSSQALLYALTQNGVLLTLRSSTRTIDKSLSLQVPAAFAMAVSSSLIACACAAGVVRLFATRTLSFKGNLPRPTTGPSTSRGTSGGGHPDGAAGGYGSGGGAVVSNPGGPRADPLTSTGSLFPDAVSCAFDSAGERLTVVYADRSLMVWDVRNPGKATRMRSVLSHAGVVWSAALIPPWQASLLGSPDCAAAAFTPPTAAAPNDHSGAQGGGGGEAFAPSSVLCTCGADGTVRLWNVCLNNSASTVGPFGVPADMAAAAKVTRTLRAIIHAVPPAALDAAGPSSAAQAAANRRYAPDAPLPVPGTASAGSGAAGAATVKPVVLRCLRVSPCGRHLAAGDARGNLRVFNLATLQLLMLKEAHDAEILSLDYSPISLEGTSYLASSSRDTLVHVYDMSRGYELVGTCDAHSGAVTAVRFSAYGGRLALLSCSADKSVVFRLVQLGSCGLSFEIYHTERMSRGVLYDMAVDPAGGRAVAVAQDSQLRLFDVATGRVISSFSGDASCGEAVAVCMDASGHLAICSCADGSVAVYDVDAGVLLARGSGHSDVCTGAVLLEDHRGLVTVGGDGCALLWRLTPRLAQRMQEAAGEARRQLEQQAAAQAAMLQQQYRDQQQRQQQQQQQQQGAERLHGLSDVTPAVRRRKAWNLGGAVDGAVGQGCTDARGEGSGGSVEGQQEEEEEEELQQVHVDMSATVLRIRQGKPLLSLEKLPKWAQRTHTPRTEGELCSGSAAYGAPVAGSAVLARTTADVATDGGYGDAATGASPVLPALAGVWAQRVARPPPLPEEAVAAAAAEEEPPVAPTATASVDVAEELPAPFANATAAAEARASALVGQPRTWAEAVEEDDEIVFCDSLEDGDGPLLLQGTAAVESDYTGPAATASGGAEAAVAATENGSSAKGTSDVGSAGAATCCCSAGGELQGASPRSPPLPQTNGESDGLASGCASNRLGGVPSPRDGATTAATAAAAAAAGDGDAVRPRDLFREHFDSLGLDQASVTKAPPPDPRRLSFSHMYRQARASSNAGGLPDGGTVTPGFAAGAAAGAGGGAALTAAAAPVAAELPPTTPYLSKLPQPPGAVNTGRGGGVDADGAVMSTLWTPDRAMLPLTSPALQKTDKQLQELERIRLRLLNTLRKRQSNEEAALGAPRAAAPPAPSPLRPPELTARRADEAAAAAPIAGAPVEQVRPAPAAAAAVQSVQRQQGLLPLGVSAAAAAHSQAAAAAAAAAAAEPLESQRAGTGNDSGSKPQPSSRAEAQSAGGFLLPPPPAYTPAPNVGEQLPHDATAAQASPGFSSLSNGTPMLGQGAGGADIMSPVPADGRVGGGTVTASVDDAGNRVFVFNPIYGASPYTPIAGAAATAAGAVGVLHRGLGGGGGAGGGGSVDGGPTCSPAELDAVEPSTDDVIRTVLESEGGASADGDDVAAAGGGVCVVTKDLASSRAGAGGGGDGGGKEQQRQSAAAAVATVSAEPQSSPGKGLQQPRRSKLALPAMKPKTGNSPAKSLGSAGAAVCSPAAGGGEATASPREVTSAAAAAAGGGGGGSAGALQMEGMLADTAEPVARMQLALRDFAVAYRRLLAAPPAGPASTTILISAGAASHYQAAARSAMAELGALLNTTQPEAGLVKPQPAGHPDHHHHQHHLHYPQQQEAGSPFAEVPPAVMCRSPVASVEMSSGRRGHHGLSRIGRGLRAGAEPTASMSASVTGAAAATASAPGIGSLGTRSAAATAATAAAAGGGPAVSSSQVLLEVGLVESMVEEKLQQRMHEEMRRMEETVLQRIMQTMMQKQ